MYSYKHVLLLLGWLSQLTWSLSVVPSLAHIPAGVRASCRSTLAKNVTQCSDVFYTPIEFINSTSLPEICTSDCTVALASLYDEAVTRCGTASVNITVNDTLLATFVPLDLVGELRYKYNLTCLQDIGFCKDRLVDASGDEMCSDCYMKSVQLEINQPLADTAYTPEEFDGLKESCGIPTSSYPVNPTPTGTPPSETATCATTYAVKAGDTANSIAKALSVATDRLLTYNGVPLDNSEPFQGGETLCLDQVSECLVHEVVAADTCSSLLGLAGSSVSELMLRSWNPTIGTSCSNLPSMLGKYICIGPPGQTDKFIPVTPTTTPAPSITAPPDTYTWEDAPDTVTSTVNITQSWIFPTDPLLIATATAEPPTASYVSAIEARVEFCPFNDEGNETLWNAGLGDEEYHLHSWDLEFECTDEYWAPYCFPEPDADILPSPTDIPSSCYPTTTVIIPEGWVNPPGPTETGIPDTCNKWHLVQTGDDCTSIAAQYKITSSQFHAYNPSINSQCGNLRAAFAVCVRIWVDPPTTATTTEATTTTTTSAGPPGPTESGTSATCTKWHLLSQGDTCDTIIAKYGIILSRFRQLNRSVDSTCSNLVVGSAYCVG